MPSHRAAYISPELPLPMPWIMRGRLLELLAMAYPPDAAQAHMQNRQDADIAWQVQSMLDDYAPAAP